jgi:hypothetical protein
MAMLSILLAAPLLSDQSAPESTPPAFNVGLGYELTFAVEWRLIRAGTVRFSWTPAGGGYQGDLHVESAGIVSKLYKVNDDYRSVLREGLCASTVTINSEEGKRKRETKVTFDQAANKVHYLERDLIKQTTVLAKETPIPECVHEYLGGLMRLRGAKLEVGQSAQFLLSDGKRVANVRVDAQEREQVKTPAGSFSAIRHEVHMFNDVLIPRKARLFVWLTDDARRLPVQIRVRMQFLIGTITLALEKENV